VAKLKSWARKRMVVVVVVVSFMRMDREELRWMDEGCDEMLAGSELAFIVFLFGIVALGDVMILEFHPMKPFIGLSINDERSRGMEAGAAV
jgi:hypothetical protein